MGILYNEVYIGSVINNKTADNIDTGHQVVQRDKEDWIIVENCHEPLEGVGQNSTQFMESKVKYMLRPSTLKLIGKGHQI